MWERSEEETLVYKTKPSVIVPLLKMDGYLPKNMSNLSELTAQIWHEVMFPIFFFKYFQLMHQIRIMAHDLHSLPFSFLNFLEIKPNMHKKATRFDGYDQDTIRIIKA